MTAPVRERNEESAARKTDGEFFATPAWVTDAILPHLLWRVSSPFPPDAFSLNRGYVTILDPCVGDGAILDRVAEAIKPWPQCKPLFYGIEVHEGRAENARGHYRVETADALLVKWPRADLCIFNPPFSLAQQFVEKALASVTQGGTVAMLARLAFLESVERYDFHSKHPMDVYVLPRRPGFLSGSGKTDMAAYAWFVAGPGRGNRWFLLEPPADALEKARAKREKKGGGS